MVVFGASNFPLAFSVAGGDTASALAAGCPVVVKAHPSHPGTSELVGVAVREAVSRCRFHPGTFSLLQSRAPGTSIALVTHPATSAVGFTGSYRAGKGHIGCGFVATRTDSGLCRNGQRQSGVPASWRPLGTFPADRRRAGQSVCLGVGQFCTNPGLVFGIRSGALDQFIEETGRRHREDAARDDAQRSASEAPMGAASSSSEKPRG